MQKISGTTLDIELVPVPAGSIEVEDPSTPGKPRAVQFEAFYLSKQEIPWEVYDVFVYGLDKPAAGVTGAPTANGTSSAADAVSRPSQPYITMDRGYGHAGYPAISVSHRGAEEFCRWLTLKSGRKYRLPSEAEWEHACRAGARTKYFFGDAAQGADSAAPGSSAPGTKTLGSFAWYRDNSEAKTHPCGTKEPNALGLHDMLGNAGEWCTSADGIFVVRGGSFRDDAEGVACSARKPDDPAWNKSDPQLPRGIWWLADAGFVGFRVLCEAPSDTSGRAR